MQFLKRNIWALGCLAVVCVLAFAGDASAQQTSSFMKLAQDKAANVFASVKTIVFILGGFGLIGLAFAAIFGKVKWPWFAALAAGLAILAAAGAIVEYATGSDVNSSRLGDTFDKSTTN